MSANMEERVGLTGSEKWVSVYPQLLLRSFVVVIEANRLVKLMYIFILITYTYMYIKIGGIIVGNSILMTMWQGFGFT